MALISDIMEIIEGKGIKTKCPNCGRERFYVPTDKTRIRDLKKRRVQCFFCGKSFKVIH